MDPIGSKVLYKIEEFKDLRTMKKGGQQDRKSRRKLVQNTSKRSKWFKVKLSLELNMIETNWFFCAARGGK